ncbi:MAG: hypothetical protein JKY66_09650 [Spongiibacteraceae bacterium]|nr:hypothetical protein [Spongiibacteraceae bacterium]
MGNLLLILLCLFGALAVVVFVAQKYAKPIDDKQQAKLSRVFIVLVFVLLVGRFIQYLLGG